MKINPDARRADISVIIPTCNRPESLRRLLDSLLRQTTQAKEIIIVDNGKEGKSSSLISSFSSSLNIRCFFEPSKRISAVRNKGISAASCSVIAFLDDDCVADPQWIEAIEGVFKDNRVQAVQGNTIQTAPSRNIYVDIFQDEYARYIQAMLSKTPEYVNMLNTQNFAVRQEVLRRFRGPFEERLSTNEDFELYWKLKKIGIMIFYSEMMKTDHYARDRLLPFLRTWYRYGFGKVQIKKIHYDFSDGYYTEKAGSIISCLRLLYREIFKSHRGGLFKDMLKQGRTMHALIYYPVLIMQRSAFIAGLYLGKKLRLPAYSWPVTPGEMVLFLTNRCNLSCRHCFYHSALAQDRYEIKSADITKVLRSLTRDLETACLVGGEPFLNQELAEICKAFAQNTYLRDLYIISNGFETGRIIEVTKNMLDNSFFNIHVRISLDGLADAHNCIRGSKSAFSNAVATIKALKQLCRKYEKLRPGVATTISQLNIKELDCLAQFVREELGVMQVFDIVRDARSMFYKNSIFINESYGPPDTNQLLTPGQIRYAAKAVKIIYRQSAKNGILKPIEEKYQGILFNATIFQALKKKPLVRCSAGESIAVIFPNYDVAICEAARPLGNLKDNDFDFTKIHAGLTAPEVKRAKECCYCTGPCYISSSIQNMRRKKTKWLL